MSDSRAVGLSHQYLLSLPERALRSMSALSAGLLRELIEVALPRAVRRTRLYTELVENTPLPLDDAVPPHSPGT